MKMKNRGTLLLMALALLFQLCACGKTEKTDDKPSENSENK